VTDAPTAMRYGFVVAGAPLVLSAGPALPAELMKAT
jgi:hypothetical protein